VLAVNFPISGLTYSLDNPIANQLLVRQLQRYKLNVVSTTDGEAAFKEWEKREPGFFTFALFDHRTPRLQNKADTSD
jgi:CheY-like chemotaxis protein